MSNLKRGTSQLKRTPMRAAKAPMNRAGTKTVQDRQQAPAKKSTLKARKIRPTAAEKIWMGLVAELGCIVCRQQGRGFVACAVHHIVEGNRRVGHLATIGLCDPGHHQNSPDAEQISRHPNKARFVAAYGDEYALLAMTQKLLKPFCALKEAA